MTRTTTTAAAAAAATTTQTEGERAPRIGVMVCSTRKPRACPQIAKFVIDTIRRTAGASEDRIPRAKEADATLHLVDLEEWNLPLFDESGVPSQILDPTQYDHEHTRRWSVEISSYDAFIFVTPQYNWGYPASLKNAIDYLYHEWKGKPAMIITYGGHGGGKCGAQLRQVLEGIHMVPTSQNVELSFGGRGMTIHAAQGKDLGLENGTGTGTGLWGGVERERIAEMYGELIDLLALAPKLNN
ncbi:hypothetical protein I317_01496 [Kwoniella heveanensis CBS 569]|nr:hypothetical protein I317_01496 [Kwoniella heveanensis CBS 569]